jgi:hypothetical protein
MELRVHELILFNNSAGKWVILAESNTSSTSSLYINILYCDLVKRTDECHTLQEVHCYGIYHSHKSCWAVLLLKCITFLVFSCNMISYTQSFHFKSKCNPNINVSIHMSKWVISFSEMTFNNVSFIIFCHETEKAVDFTWN